MAKIDKQLAAQISSLFREVKVYSIMIEDPKPDWESKRRYMRAVDAAILELRELGLDAGMTYVEHEAVHNAMLDEGKYAPEQTDADIEWQMVMDEANANL